MTNCCLKNKLNIITTLVFFIISIILISVYKFSMMYVLSVFMLFVFSECTKTDIQIRIIPNMYMFIGLLIGIIELFTYFVFNFAFYNSIFGPITGLLLLPGLLCIVALVLGHIRKKELIGFGDIKALAVVGFFIGYQYQFVFIVFSLIMAFVYSTVISIKNRSFNTTIPMAPFMFAGLFLTILMVGITRV